MKSARPGPRYRIRNAAGEELVCPTLADLHALYAQGFLDEHDLVRSEGSTRWVPVSALPALRGVQERRTSPRKVSLVIAAGAALAAALALLARGLR
ncbi:MAG TPA: hypothetical protein VFP65_25775 [Anaeromyxobacteraceae bacterium]|nr:hypothetical protein [Anaeromyxobacteraceae bacterium]